MPTLIKGWPCWLKCVTLIKESPPQFLIKLSTLINDQRVSTLIKGWSRWLKCVSLIKDSPPQFLIRLSTLINDQRVSTLLKECQAGPLITNRKQNRMACGVMNIDAKHAHNIKTGSKWHANYGHSFGACFSPAVCHNTDHKTDPISRTHNVSLLGSPLQIIEKLFKQEE